MSTAVGSSAGRGWAVRALGHTVSILLIILTVGAADQIIKHTPGSEEVARPFIQSGGTGRAVDGRTFAALVSSVQGAKTVVNSAGDQYRTDGVFVVVHVTVTARDNPVALLHEAVVDRAGRSFSASDRLNQRLDTGYTFQPGIVVEGDMVFEIPPGAGPGLVLQLSSDQVLDSRNQSIAQVDLGIDQATVTSWLTSSQPITIKNPEVAA